MKHLIISTICTLGMMQVAAINVCAENRNVLNANDNFYYSGNNKIILHKDPTQIVICNSVASDFNSDMAKLQKTGDLSFNVQIGTDDFSVRIYDVTKTAQSSKILSNNVKYWSCYTNDEGTPMAPDGYINVILKKSEDLPILKKQAELNKCIFTSQSELNPLRCAIRITDKTEGSPVEIANSMYETGEFEAVTPSFYYPNLEEISYDIDVLKQWGLYNADDPYIDIDISEAWGYSTGRGIKIAIIDSGIDHNHEDLKENLSNLSYDASLKTTPATQYNTTTGHGTHCAGIAAAVRNNNLQVCGVAPDAQIINIRYNSYAGNFISQAADAIDWAWKNGADIISCSWGCSSDPSIISAINNALTKGRDGKGCIIIKSAGNNGDKGGAMTFPGNYNDDVISVGAIAKSGKRAYFSSWGDFMFVCAPGEGII